MISVKNLKLLKGNNDMGNTAKYQEAISDNKNTHIGKVSFSAGTRKVTFTELGHFADWQI